MKNLRKHLTFLTYGFSFSHFHTSRFSLASRRWDWLKRISNDFDKKHELEEGFWKKSIEKWPQSIELDEFYCECCDIDTSRKSDIVLIARRMVKGVPVEIWDPSDHFHCHFRTKWRRKPLEIMNIGQNGEI